MNHANPPATPKCLWYTWDFVQRTRFNINNIDIGALDAGDLAAAEAYEDAVGRCALTNMIISDTSGRTAEQICGERAVDFGANVRAKAKALRPDREAVG